MELTDKQKKFVDECMKLCHSATRAALKTFGSLSGFKNTHLTEDPVGMVADCIRVLEDERAGIYQKQACLLIMKALVVKELREMILDNPNLYPIDRNDPRVTKWKNKVLAVRHCEICGDKNSLCAHHIIRWADYPKGRTDAKNGQCLCAKCHAEQHKGQKAYHMLKAQADRRKAMIAEWAELGLTDEQIAGNIGISRSTLAQWKINFSDIADTLKANKEVADSVVENALYKNAIGYEYNEVTQERSPESGEMVVTKIVTKQATPNTSAQIFWLKNRQPDVWRDRKEVAMDGEMSINNPYAGITTDELKKLISDK
ncbi:HNH endonuclease [Popillia japonica]|uniref:HNH endonuclease n=1 Tax=Popillia japonica TaxID=7064 RepID=A0AAW1HSP5_POPJA